MLWDEKEGKGVFYCNTTDSPMKPIFMADTRDELLYFKGWARRTMGEDLRRISEERLYDMWVHYRRSPDQPYREVGYYWMAAVDDAPSPREWREE